MTDHNFWIFALTAFMLNITPGNDMLYVASRSTGQGVKAGIVSALGITGGCLVHLVAAVAGLSAIVAQSVIAFSIIKYAGAAYLVYLGVKSLVSKSGSFNVQQAGNSATLIKIFRQGVITNILNPKVALFFLAFLPQFVHVNQPGIAWQILFLGMWFNISGTVVNILVAVLFGRLASWFSRSGWFMKWQQKITGAILIALGIKVALTSGTK